MTAGLFAALLFGLAFGPMIGEALVARRNEQALRARGAVEPGNDVYPIMQIVYPAAFAGMILEGWLRAATPTGLFSAGLIVFAGAKALKYWAIATLGSRWTFRVLVLPHAPLIGGGPYRWLRHPNYVAVVGELGGMALMARALLTGPLVLAMFSVILLARIRIEDRALGRRASQ
jgi:methyltransferase